MAHAAVVATVDRFPVTDDDLSDVSSIASILELRADRAGEVDPVWLRARFHGELLYTAGATTCTVRERRELLRRAAASWDLVTLEQGDLVDSVLREIPPHKRVITWRGPSSDIDELRHRLRHLTATPARLYVLEVVPKTVAGQLHPLALLHAEQRTDVIAFASGASGVWTRIVAPRLGAPVIFSRLGDDYGEDGTPPTMRLADDYGFPDLWPAAELFAMAGNPVMHSLSPRIHNSGYRALGREALYVAFQVDDFGEFWREVVASGALDRLGLPLRGISVVSPFKAVALAATQRRSAMVDRARSTNLLRREGEEWIAETTDADGVMLTLRDHSVVLRNRRAAVIGCGGSGRAMAAALQQAGADVTLVNRGLERGSLAVRLLRLPFMPLSAFSAEPYSIFVNATPVGREEDETPFAVEKLPRDAVVVDLVYRSGATSLITRTRGPGRITIDGTEMLLAQAARQFELMTGEEMPEGLARAAIGLAEAAVVEQG